MRLYIKQINLLLGITVFNNYFSASFIDIEGKEFFSDDGIY